MTNEDLQALVSEWQARLGLMHWDIKVELCRRQSMTKSSRQAEIYFNLDRFQAMIKILDPIDWPQECWWQQDAEEDLVHELIHLQMAPFDPAEGTLAETAQEQCINLLARALVKLKREAVAHAKILPETS